MIALSTITYDIQGHVVIRETPESILPDLTRRVTRTATLDGESTISDLGFTYSDMTYVVRSRSLSDDQIAILEAMIKTYPLVRISTSEGAFIGAISAMTVGRIPVEFTLLIKQKIS